jgi:hypothetical protein
MTYKMDKDSVVFLVFVASFMFMTWGPPTLQQDKARNWNFRDKARNSERAIVEEAAAP